MKKTVLVYSVLIVALLALFHLSKYAYASGDMSIEIIISGVAITFLCIGIYLNKQRLQKDRTPKGVIDTNNVKKLGLSNREYEVLLEISKGLSNKEISDQLYVSESTN